jgi:tetratricopeptide (TPR) repeat protein
MSGAAINRRGGAAAVIMAMAGILLFAEGCRTQEKDASKVQKPSDSKASDQGKARQVPKKAATPQAKLEILLSVNESQDDAVLYTDTDCLLEVRLRNVRAYLEFVRNSGRKPVVPAIDLGSAERPWDRMVRFFIVSADRAPGDAGRTIPARMIPAPEGEGPRLSLGGGREGRRVYLASSDAFAGLKTGDYFIYADVEPESATASASKGKTESNSVFVKLSAFPEQPTPEDFDVRASAQARCALAEGNKDKARQILDAALEKTGTAVQSLILKADLLEESGRMEEASQCLEKALDAIVAERTAAKKWSEPPDYLLMRLNALRKKITDKPPLPPR